MNAETRIRLQIGDLVIQVQAAHAKIEDLEKEIAELKAKLPSEQPE